MSEVVEVNEEDSFDDVLDIHETVVVRFTAPWCGPCKQFGPVFRSVAEQVDAKFVDVDIEEAPWAMARYGFSSIPTVLKIEGGTVKTLKERRPIPFLNEVR